jgi:transposase
MATRNKGLRRKEALAVALLESPSVVEACRRVGISENTAYRWLREDAEFQELFRGAKRRLLDLALTRLESITSKAIGTLEEILEAGTHEPARVSASRTILEMVLKLREHDEILERLEVLEKRILERGGEEGWD